MYDNTIKDKFVELRAEGKSFGQISEELGVVKSTLHRWADERAGDILSLRRREWEDTECNVGWRIEDQLAELNTSIEFYETHLRRFSVGHLNLRDTVMVLRETRRQRDRLRALLMGTPARAKKCGGTNSVESQTSPESSKNGEEPPTALPLPRGYNCWVVYTVRLASKTSKLPLPESLARHLQTAVEP
jgi:hypothetical protein